MTYKTKIEVNLTFADHRVISYVAEKYKISRVMAVQLMLDTSSLFNDNLKELQKDSSTFGYDFEEREQEIAEKRKNIE